MYIPRMTMVQKHTPMLFLDQAHERLGRARLRVTEPERLPRGVAILAIAELSLLSWVVVISIVLAIRALI